MGERILIASHTFPPAPGIGGRRWAKFAAAFAANGASVHVLTVAQRTAPAQRSIWSEDVAHIPMSFWEHRFPGALEGNPPGTVAKLSYRMALAFNLLMSSGTPYDRALYNEKSFVRALETAIAGHRPDVVVVTAPPFRLLYYAAALTAKYPDVIWCADLRDPWTNGISYGYAALSPRRKAWELRAEQKVMECFDIVTSPWESVVAYLQHTHPQASERIRLLPHAWDPADVGSPAQPTPGPVPHLVYGGNLYPEFNAVVQGLHHLAKAGKATITIYSEGSCPIAFTPGEGFEWRPPVVPRQFFAEAKKAQMLLFFIPENARNGMPSKIYEYAATGVPLLAVGHTGTLQQLIVREGLGLFVSHTQGAEGLQRALAMAAHAPAAPQWAARYALESVTMQLLHTLRNTTPSST
jgi:hypothetical protein